MAIRQKNIESNFNLVGVAANAAAYLEAVGKTAAAEGDTYYDTTLNILRTYDGSAWSNAGANSQSVGSLNDAATVGGKITGLAVEIEGTDTAIGTDGALLLLDNDDTGSDVHALEITSTSTAPAIQITNDTATTDDIQGTGDSWAVTGQGNAAFNSVLLADSKALNIGSSNDITVQWDGTDLLIDGAAADTVIKIGASNNQDIIIYGDTVTDLVTFDTSAELMSLDGFDLQLKDSDYLKFGDAGDVTLAWDGSNLLIEAAVDNTGQVRIGSTNAIDLAVYGSTATNIALFDVSSAVIELDGWDVNLQDADSLFFGDSNDITIQWDGTDLLIDGAAADTVIKIGATNNQNLQIFGATATNYILFDTDDTAKKVTFEHFHLELQDDSDLRFGDSDDIVIQWHATNGLVMTSAAASSAWAIGAVGNVINATLNGTLTVGVNDTGYDVKLFGATSGAYLLWDESADDLILAGAAGLSVAGATTLTGAVTCAAGLQCASVAVTATDTGATTGTIPDGSTFVTVNADSDADHIVVLPTPTPGNIVYITEDGTTGYELRSSAPATVAINGGTGENAESAIAGTITYIKCVCVSATSWICTQFDADGDESKVEAAA